MTSLILDSKKIKGLIKFGKYEEAAEKIFAILEDSQNFQNKDLVYTTLSLLNLISDKTPSISLRAAKNVRFFINDINSWIRLVSLEILYQISKYRPNLLIDLIDKIRARMHDRDIPVRRLAVKIMGTLILSLHIDMDDLRVLIEEYTEKLLDNDWKVKLQAIKTIKTILNEDYTKIPELEPLLSIVIINLRDEDEDVARASAELLKLIGTYFLSKEKILHVLLNLLYNEVPKVKKHVIWLFGEIGKEKSSEIIPFIPKLINILKEPEYSLQMRAMEALVNIGKNNFDQIWSNLINSLDLGDQEFRNNLLNTLYHLCETNFDKVFPRIFEEIENPSENIRKSISLVLKRLFDEHPTEINTEIAKIFYKLESKFWRKRQEAIHLLLNLFSILKDEKLAIWILIEFNETLKKEKDHDVKKEIIDCMEKISTSFKDIPEKL
ncbi:MAG: sister chromatid cohesion protein PDS5, partial [Promethearchaeota archaeon]